MGASLNVVVGAEVANTLHLLGTRLVAVGEALRRDIDVAERVQRAMSLVEGALAGCGASRLKLISVMEQLAVLTPAEDRLVVTDGLAGWVGAAPDPAAYKYIAPKSGTIAGPHGEVPAFSDGPSTWPLPPGQGTLTQHFKGARSHAGVDIAAAVGTPIYATVGGRVETQPTSVSGGYGNMVIVHGTDGKEYMYAHQTQWAVEEGSVVEPGQLIGYVGNTGRSTGPHLHYEVRQNGQPIAPEVDR